MKPSNDLIDAIEHHQYKVITNNTASLSNSSKLIRLDDNSEYYLRYPSSVNDKVVSREDEKILTEELYRLRMTPYTVFLDNNQKISKRVLDDDFKHDEVNDQLRLLAIMHSLDIPIDKNKDKCSQYISKYAHIVNDDIADRLVYQYKELELDLFYYGCKKVLCHFDAVSDNLVYDMVQSYLIDFEYSGYYYREFDLASIAVDRSMYSDSEITKLIENYRKFCPNYDKNRETSMLAVETGCLMVCILWFLWGLAYYKETNDKRYWNESKNYRDKYSKYSKLVQSTNNLIPFMDKLLDKR